METRSEDRSLFWPIVLIGAGTIWLLANFNLIPDLSWATLLRLWPLALIAAGLDMLFGRSHPLVGALIGLLTVGAAVALLVAGPRLGLAPAAPTVKTETFSEPLDGAETAEIVLDLTRYPTTVSALAGEGDLIRADLTHAGTVNFSASGGADRQVRLDYQGVPGFFFFDFDERPGEWEIGLSPAVPLRLVVDAGSGTAALDLRELALREMRLDGGSGAVSVTLPPADEPYELSLDGGSGAQTVRLPVGAAGTLRYDGGSGSLRLEVAGGGAVRVEVRDSGSGQVRVPGAWEVVSSGADDEGIWQSATYDDAEDRGLLIIIDDVGSGSIAVAEQ